MQVVDMDFLGTVTLLYCDQPPHTFALPLLRGKAGASDQFFSQSSGAFPDNPLLRPRRVSNSL